MSKFRVICTVVLCLAGSGSAFAQSWSFDARKIGMGSVGGNENLASRMAQEREDYRSIVLPFGLLQVLSDFDRLRPDSDDFSIVSMVEYAASPLHYTFGRHDEAVTGRDFLVDIRHAAVSRDLSDYRGFKLSTQPAAEGLASPNWGGTIRIKGTQDGPYHGIYIGGGPYLAMRTVATIDEQVVDILGSDSPLRFANDRFDLANDTTGQLAAAITGGYRGRFNVGSGSDRDGVYVAMNVNYLRGFRYEDVDSALRLDTDAGGLLTFNRLLPAPLRISRTSATSGRGVAVDAGVSAIVKGWELGFGVNGIANHINWTGAEQTTYALTSVLFGDDELIEGAPVPVGDVRVELPVDYRVNGGYHARDWSAMTELAHGFQGSSFHGGFEYRFRVVDVRAGGFFTRDLWQPTAGVGLNMGERLSLDVALFGNAANVARERRRAIAVSLRLNH